MNAQESLEKQLDSFSQALAHCRELLKSSASSPLEVKKLDSEAKSAKIDDEISRETQKESPLDQLVSITSLVKAHTTKIALTFNPPVACEAATTCLGDLSMTLPHLVATTLTLDAEKESKIMKEETTNKILRLITSMLRFLEELKLVDIYDQAKREKKVEDGDDKREGNDEGRDQSHNSRLVTIGQVWESCDSISKLKETGLSGLIKAKIDSYSDLISDSLEELKEYKENPKDTLNGWGLDDFSDSEDDTKPPIEKNNENNGNKVIEISPDMIKFSKKWEAKLELISKIYKGITIYRFGRTSKTINMEIPKLNQLISLIDSIAATCDDIVAEIMDSYLDPDFDQDLFDDLENRMVSEIKKLVGLSRLDVKQEEDHFTKWADQFLEKHFTS
ncbi:hypothetical protein NADFUDRAFT_48452 [Nadsonia fulvescens var. elongata DSM 6958]|uniref:Cyclin-D1-binding protein 1-like N-terminal domain-containing protein n=1 Tax=Nadsonia fulvescens var. elongata DSM 6958 TaxID=857566 RepID=A0A1E3PQR6_9ASCO|nr:hypothetical protein NADFUDRAFT_48452 [Nadsonia fulvescens var. elongata DSM 6958]